MNKNELEELKKEHKLDSLSCGEVAHLLREMRQKKQVIGCLQTMYKNLYAVANINYK